MFENVPIFAFCTTLLGFFSQASVIRIKEDYQLLQAQLERSQELHSKTSEKLDKEKSNIKLLRTEWEELLAMKKSLDDQLMEKDAELAKLRCVAEKVSTN